MTTIACIFGHESHKCSSRFPSSCWSSAAGFHTYSSLFAVCAFPYILAFTTDSIEIRLVVNGNLVYTAVVPELQLAASRVSMTQHTSMPSLCRQIHCTFMNYLFYSYFTSKANGNLVEMQSVPTSDSFTKQEPSNTVRSSHSALQKWLSQRSYFNQYLSPWWEIWLAISMATMQ